MRVGPALRNPLSGWLNTLRGRAVAVAVVVVIVDQLTKRWAERALVDGDIVVIPSVIRFHLTENPGSAFSLFQNSGSFLAVAAVAAAVLIWWTVPQVTHRVELAGMSLIMGGALGNMVDRITRGDGLLDGAVVDFIDFPNWPTFNVADSAITIGAGLVLWAAIRNR